jgi:hypothetical protein
MQSTLIKTRKLYELQSRHIIMALPVFVVSTADSEGVLGVLTIGRLHTTVVWSPHTSQIFQDRFCHMNAIPTRKPETGSLVTRAKIFVFFGNKQSKYY